jgi:chromosome segregation ATPase
MSGGTRRWGWGGGGGGGRAASVRADAQAAKDDAATAFYELDTAQRGLRISIETIQAVDDSPAGRRAVAEFADFGSRIDRVSADYISTVDSFDLDRDDLDQATAMRAHEQLRKVTNEMERTRSDLQHFEYGLRSVLEKAETQLARLAPAVERARQALRAATEALEKTRAAGLRADDLAERLARLGPELTRLNEGAGQHGVAETLQRADRVAREAEVLRGEADRLPEKAAEIDKRLSSLRTRAEALHTRAKQVEPVLSELRRRFSLACWQDLQHVPQEAERSARQAEERLREARQAREQQRWSDATSLLATVRALMNTTDEAVKAAGERLQRLNEVSFDHAKEVERVRFAIRDAQRLAMAGRATPDPRHAGPLDQAVERVDRAVAGLTGPHPDYWRFLTELDAVKESVHGVVESIRGERAGG